MRVGRIDPRELPDLPVTFMNEGHQREIALLNDLEEDLAAHARGASLDGVLAKLALLAVSTREHFLHEETAMREGRFAAYAVHKAEHDRVLAEMDREARLFRQTGDAERLAGYLFEVLPTWYRTHVRTMDVVTAQYLADRAEREGAAP